MSDKITLKHLIEKKKNGQKITMLTAYDYPLAVVLERSQVDIILVGDSLANVVLGLDDTKQVGMAEMIHHAKAVGRAVKRAFLVGDMPYESYQVNTAKCVDNAKRFIDEAGCDAVKLEWFDKCLEVAAKIVKSGVAVMGHVGLTPQTADKLGGFKVQGKDAKSAEQIIQHALELEQKGCFSIVLECIPDAVAEIITKRVKIPTIGIGAGPNCDGQVLVTYDLLGLFTRHHPKFVKQYMNLSDMILNGVNQYCEEVVNGSYPDEYHSYPMNMQELNKMNGVKI